MRRLKTFLCLGIVGCFVASAGAATYYVGPTRDFKRIQEAINHCNNGDTVLVDPGTYVGKAATMLFDSQRNITIKGNGGRPVLDMGPDHSVSVWGKGLCNITPNASNITFDNLEMINGVCRDTAQDGNAAGITWSGGGMLRINNCEIRDCEMGIRGLSKNGGSLLIENSVLHDNTSTDRSIVVAGDQGAGSVEDITVRYKLAVQCLGLRSEDLRADQPHPVQPHW